jgi:hypothetical protein
VHRECRKAFIAQEQQDSPRARAYVLSGYECPFRCAYECSYGHPYKCAAESVYMQWVCPYMGTWRQLPEEHRLRRHVWGKLPFDEGRITLGHEGRYTRPFPFRLAPAQDGVVVTPGFDMARSGSVVAVRLS